MSNYTFSSTAELDLNQLCILDNDGNLQTHNAANAKFLGVVLSRSELKSGRYYYNVQVSGLVENVACIVGSAVIGDQIISSVSNPGYVNTSNSTTAEARGILVSKNNEQSTCTIILY